MTRPRGGSGQVSDWGNNIVVDQATTANTGYMLTVDPTKPGNVNFEPRAFGNRRIANAYGIPGAHWVAGGAAENWNKDRLWISGFFVPRTSLTVTGLSIRISTAGSAGSTVGIGVFELPDAYSGNATPVVVTTVAGDGAAGIKNATGLSTVLKVGTYYGLGFTHNSTTALGIVRRGFSPSFGSGTYSQDDQTQRLVSAVDGYTTTQMAALTAVSVTSASAGSGATGDWSVVFMQWTD